MCKFVESWKRANKTFDKLWKRANKTFDKFAGYFNYQGVFGHLNGGKIVCLKFRYSEKGTRI